jgi:hypothetical protein
MAEAVSFELFSSEHGVFLSFPQGSAVFAADTFVLSSEHRKLTAMKDGEPLGVVLPKLTVELVDVLSSRESVVAVAMALGGITHSGVIPVTVKK